MYRKGRMFVKFLKVKSLKQTMIDQSTNIFEKLVTF